MYAEILLSIVFFVFGLLSIKGGVSIVRKREVYRMDSGKYRWSPSKPVLLKGKQAVSQGVGYIAAGCIFIIASALLFFPSLKVLLESFQYPR